MNIPDKLKEKLLHMHYKLAGHSAVEICSWTKKHLRNQGSCYKRKFYGVDTNRCAQIGPMAVWCEHNCIFCWRPMELMGSKIDGKTMEPQEMIDGLIEGRKKLLSGFKGFEGTDKEKFWDAYNLFPNHWAISLSGEPTLYDKLDELIKLLKENQEVRSIFLVSNGEEPEVLENLKNLPIQLYISINAPNEELYKKIACPNRKDGWERLNKTLSLLKNLKTRTVLRLTLIKGINDSEELIEQYVKLFEKTEADFIEVKSYMHIGYSRERLEKSNMPTHEEVLEFSKKLENKFNNYKIIDQHKPSRIVLLKNNNSKINNIIIFNDPKHKDVYKITSKWRIYDLLKRYRKVRLLLDKYGFNSWNKDYLTLEEHLKTIDVNMDNLIKKINEFIIKEYLKN